MQARRTIGSLLIVLVTALVGAWLYALAGSGAQLDSLFRTPGSTTSADPSRPAAQFVEPSPSFTVEPPAAPAPAERIGTRETVQSDADLAEPAGVVEPEAGPIDAAAFAELLDSGLIEEGDDPAAADALRDALREAAADAEVDEPE